MAHKPLCLRCHTPLAHIRTTSFLTRDDDPLLPISYVRESRVGSIELEIHCCPICGHVEFFRHDSESGFDETDSIAQTKCPKCGRMHDIDYPKCPFCKYDYHS